MENIYKNGEVVFDRMRPNQKLVISSYSNNIYCCIPQEESTQKQLVYFERELKVYPPIIKDH